MRICSYDRKIEKEAKRLEEFQRKMILEKQRNSPIDQKNIDLLILKRVKKNKKVKNNKKDRTKYVWNSEKLSKRGQIVGFFEGK